jgi:hypothetical protein
MFQITELQVSSSPGAGGNWLASVLNYCITPNSEWITQKINFHSVDKIKFVHNPVIDNNTLSIGNNLYKYNFWKLYLHKHVLRSCRYVRVRGKKFIVNPYNNKDHNNKDSFFWLINQCRFIQSYQCGGKFQIDWQDLFAHPERAWTTICNFLEHNNKKNHINFSQFKMVLNNYTKTCQDVNYKVNVNHRLFLIWSLAFLQNNDFAAPFDIFDKFDSEELMGWIHKFQPIILDYTYQNRLLIG